MKIDENIASIISKYILGVNTQDETRILNDWLKHAHNKLQFKKFINGKVLVERSEFYEYENIEEKWKEFHNQIGHESGFRKILSYAAAILLPIGLALGILLYTDGHLEEKEQIVLQSGLDDKLVLIAEDGSYHSIDSKDTLISTSNSTFVIENNTISVKDKKLNSDAAVRYNTLSIPKGQQYELQLSDGTKVWLNSDTKFKYPSKFTQNTRKVILESGEAYFEVEKDKNKPFVLQVHKSQVKVLGTCFNVRSYDKSSQMVTLVEGSVELNHPHDKVLLKPNQQAYMGNGLSYEVCKVNATDYIYWKDYIFNYKIESLENILDDLSRTYDVKFFYQNQSCKDKKYTLRLKKSKNIQEVLEVIERLKQVTFDIKGSNIIVK